MLKLIKNALKNKDRRAIIADGQSYTYGQLLDSSADFASILLENEPDLKEKRVAFMVSPSFQYACVQWQFGVQVVWLCRCASVIRCRLCGM